MLTKGSIVMYTSKAGRSSLYVVIWVGPDKYNAGKTRVGLVRPGKGGDAFFVDSELCTLQQPVAASAAA